MKENYSTILAVSFARNLRVSELLWTNGNIESNATDGASVPKLGFDGHSNVPGNLTWLHSSGTLGVL